MRIDVTVKDLDKAIKAEKELWPQKNNYKSTYCARCVRQADGTSRTM